MNPTNPTNPQKIVILDPDQVRRNYLRSVISSWGYMPYCFEKETICLDNLAALAPDLAVCGNPAVEKIFRFVAGLRLISRKLPVLIWSSNHSLEDYIQTNGMKPVFLLKENINPSEIKKTITDHINCRSDDERVSDCPLMIGNSPEIIKIKKLIPELSRSRETILIQGESGTGKELLAKIIYFMSDRNNKPFVKVDAAAIFPAAAKKVLDGVQFDDHFYSKVSTDAVAGTVFLDRIELLPADLQGSLLHIIEESGAIGFKNGSEKSTAVRIIASANAELEPMVSKNVFRKDLFYRLNVLSVAVPPLRDRREDIPLLSYFFADKFCLESGRSFFEIPSKIKTVLFDYHWPENVAELENMIREFAASGDEDKITQKIGSYCHNGKRRDIADFLGDFNHPGMFDLKKYANHNKKLSMKEICRIYRDRTEGELITKTLEFTGWNRKKTAKMLGVSYKSLLNKIKAYGVEKH